MSESDRIPITVGVVGHRDAITTQAQRLQITRFFYDLASMYPNSPIYLFSSIADGADRFVASIFLDVKNRSEGFKQRFELIVPTPFKTEEYKKDFDEDSKKEFDALLNQAKRHFCVDCDDNGNNRPQQYLRAGKFVADSSIILIAIWDGEPGEKGGTAEIVHHKITGDNDNVAESTFEYDGTVFVLPCKRIKSSSKVAKESDSALTIDIVLKNPAIREALGKIEEINSVSLTIAQSEFEKSRSDLFNSPEKLDAPQNSLQNWYSVLDNFSLYFQGRGIFITICLFTIGFFLIMSLEVYSNLLQSNLMLGFVMLFATLATFIYLYSKNAKNHKKYLYYRTLAEALRIQFYWNIAGINKNVSDYILRIHRQDFTWIKYIMSAIYGVTFNHKNINAETINGLIHNWVKNQSGFYKSSVTRMTKQLGFFNKISNISFIISIALVVSIFFFEDYYKTNNYLNHLLVINGTLLGLFALIKGYIKMKGYEQLLNQYELMNVIYARAESKAIETETYNLNQDQRNSYLKELFFVIGKEALIENGNWYLIFKEKEPEIEGI